MRGARNLNLLDYLLIITSHYRDGLRDFLTSEAGYLLLTPEYIQGDLELEHVC